ncbi:MAG TPA: hypothetical protein VK123_08610, partial [Candidatus Limnocylindrales bacterium]|nr:hypothetical protein [Candidatus Limnocylindrales bacterium]
MVIVLRSDATPEQRHAVEARLRDCGFQVVFSPNGMPVTMAAVGEGTMPELDVMRGMAGVADARRIPSPFKLASRVFRENATVVRVGDVEIGGKSIVLMAGPCTIESEEQLVRTGAAVYAAG